MNIFQSYLIKYSLYWAPFWLSYRMGLLFPLDQNFFGMTFVVEKELERSDSESGTGGIGSIRSKNRMETHLEQ